VPAPAGEAGVPNTTRTKRKRTVAPSRFFNARSPFLILGQPISTSTERAGR
jgi:hypothetical protein